MLRGQHLTGERGEREVGLADRDKPRGIRYRPPVACTISRSAARNHGPSRHRIHPSA